MKKRRSARPIKRRVQGTAEQANWRGPNGTKKEELIGALGVALLTPATGMAAALLGVWIHSATMSSPTAVTSSSTSSSSSSDSDEKAAS